MISGRALFLLKKYSAFLEKGWADDLRHGVVPAKKYSAFLEKGWADDLRQGVVPAKKVLRFS